MINDEPLFETAVSLRTGGTDPSTYLDTLEDRAERVEPRIEALLNEPNRWTRLEREASALEARFDDSATRPPL